MLIHWKTAIKCIIPVNIMPTEQQLIPSFEEVDGVNTALQKHAQIPISGLRKKMIYDTNRFSCFTKSTRKAGSEPPLLLSRL